MTQGKLRNGTVTAAKVRNGTLTREDFAANVLLKGERGPAGAAGAAGAPAAASDIGFWVAIL